jgi:acyl-CoA hydrolase
MNNNKTKPVQVVLTYKANNSEKDNLSTKVVTSVSKAEKKLTKLDDNHKLVRRYSFDDNGGGYLGL